MLEGIYGPDCRRLPDELRYACLVGVMGATFRASKVRSIEQRITNRNLLVMGPRPLQPALQLAAGGAAATINSASMPEAERAGAAVPDAGWCQPCPDDEVRLTRSCRY